MNSLQSLETVAVVQFPLINLKKMVRGAGVVSRIELRGNKEEPSKFNAGYD